MQKTFFEVFKQHQGEYLGSVLSGWLESMLPLVKSDGGELELGDDTFDKGLANAVKDNDDLYPPDWRLSYGARGKPAENEELAGLRKQIEELQQQVRDLERKVPNR